MRDDVGKEQVNKTMKCETGHGRRTAASWLSAVALALIGLAGTNAAIAAAAAPTTAAPATTPPAASAQEPAAGAAPAVADVKRDATDYVIGPGDTLQIYVWQHTDLSVTVPVRPDGKISTPLVEDLVAVNRTPFQLARDIETRLKEYVRTPQVNVIVTNPANAFNQVKIIGEVKAPGSLPYRAGMTAMDAILQVGGMSEFAAGNRATLVRKAEDGKEERIKLRLSDLINKGKMDRNVELRPGDLVIVPASLF
jgi:polysaccharide biosynthesis/export protein